MSFISSGILIPVGPLRHIWSYTMQQDNEDVSRGGGRYWGERKEHHRYLTTLLSLYLPLSLSFSLPLRRRCHRTLHYMPEVVPSIFLMFLSSLSHFRVTDRFPWSRIPSAAWIFILMGNLGYRFLSTKTRSLFSTISLSVEIRDAFLLV